MNYLKYIQFLAFIISLAFGTVHHVPEEYSTIQRGINAASNGDTVLVNQGFYCENIILTKSIVLTSYAIYDDLDDWLIGQAPNIDVANPNIRNTIIDGGSELCDGGSNSMPSGTSYDTINVGSAILIAKLLQEEECITPTVFGFTIQGGEGTYVRMNYEIDSEDDYYSLAAKAGMGILTTGADPSINYNRIINNGLTPTRAHSTGAVYGETINEDFDFLNLDFDDEEIEGRCDIEIFDMSNNYFRNNYADFGRIFANRFSDDTFDMSGSVFDVAGCDNQSVSAAWVNIEEEAEADYTDIQSQLCAFQFPNVYVNPNIAQECIVDGCGTTPENPFKKLSWALAMILPSENHPVTINLADATYSPETDPQLTFPINLEYITLKGESQEGTIVSADNTGILFENFSNSNKIETLSLQNGFSVFLNNTTMIHMGENTTLENVNIYGNTIQEVNGHGTMIHMSENTTLENVNIYGNTIQELDADGTMIHVGENATLENVNIYENTIQVSEDAIITNIDTNATLETINIYENTLEDGAKGFLVRLHNNLDSALIHKATLSNLNIYSNISLINYGRTYIVYLYNTESIIDNIEIYDNHMGMGAYNTSADILLESENSQPSLSNINAYNNIIDHGIKIIYSNPVLMYNIILDNSGGIFIGGSDDFIIKNITIQNFNTDTQAEIMNIVFSNNVKIGNLNLLNNITNDWGGGVVSENSSNIIISNALISGNISEGIGAAILVGPMGNLKLINSTIINNTVTEPYDNIEMEVVAYYSDIEILNSIIWDDNIATVVQDEFYEEGIGSLVIEYSNIQGGEDAIIDQANILDWSNDTNLNEDPMLDDNFNLQAGSPCIDMANPNTFYNDLDFTRGDMGFTGGSILIPEFLEYNFGEVGNIPATTTFELSNLHGQENRVVNIATFSTDSFSTDTTFPLIIEPLTSQNITITCSNPSSDGLNDQMVMSIEGFPYNVEIDLHAIGTDQNVLSGHLSGIIPTDIYQISGDLTIAQGDTTYFESGSQFLFDGEYSLTVNGELQAIGTEQDSIIFENYDSTTQTPWRGIYLLGASSETILEYVRISGAQKTVGAGIYMENSSPILRHMMINHNNSIFTLNTPAFPENNGGGGIFLLSSHPILDYVSINNNYTFQSGGGINFYYSNPQINHIEIINNTSDYNGGGIIGEWGVEQSNSTNVYTVEINNSIISNNTSGGSGGGIDIRYVKLKLDNVTIDSNYADNRGGGCRQYGNERFPLMIDNSSITNNQSDEEGGGLYLTQPSAADTSQIKNSIISNNIAASKGGGLYLDLHHGTDFRIGYSLITDNHVRLSDDPLNAEATGGGFYLKGASTIHNTTICNNTVEDNQGFGGFEIYAYGFIDFINSILWGNSLDEETGLQSDYYYGNTDIYNCNIENAEQELSSSDYENGTNIYSDPLFINPSIGDYSLQQYSPCIDMGTDDLNQDGIIDIFNYFGDAPDIGAHEWVLNGLIGDFNQDGMIDIIDIIYLVNFIIDDLEYDESVDLNQNGIIDIIDVIMLINLILDN